jgi:hypothetical protein
MRSGWRNALALIAMLTVIAFVAGVIWQIHASRHPVDAMAVSTATVYATYLAAVAIGITLLMAVGGWWRKGHSAIADRASATAQAAADQLADVTTGRWRLEAAARRIITPAPATVHWRWATDDVAVPRLEVTIPPAAGTGPPALPDLGRLSKPLPAGMVSRIHDEVYARLPYGRLVILGGPGSGKTGAMILLLLAALDYRAALPVDHRARVPVPVWLTLGGWDPVTTSLQDWAVATMNRDFPALRAADYGPDAARELLRGSRIALFLDGLDEIPDGARELALKRVDAEARGLRVVVTSRPEEYRHVLPASRPDNTAVIELQPIRPEAAAAYLQHGQIDTGRSQWERLGAYLTRNPDSVAARALDNPLNLSLARDAYTSQDPAALTDLGRFPTVEAIQEHLIGQFLITAYPDRHQRVRAIRWLGWIAHHMGTSQDLPWWDIPTWVPWWQIRVARGAIFGLMAGLAFGSLFGIGINVNGNGFGGGIKAGLVGGSVVALGVGLWVALATRQRVLAHRRRRWLLRGLAVALLAACGSWLIKGPGAGLVIGFASVMTVLAPRAVTAGLVAYVVSGTVVGTYDATEVPGWLNLWIVASIDFGLAYGISGGLIFGLPGAPQTLAFRIPQRRELGRIVVVALLFFPLLVLVFLNLWATPAADSSSATAVGTYRADRRTGMIYGLALGVAGGLVFGFLAWFMIEWDEHITWELPGLAPLFGPTLAIGLGLGLWAGLAVTTATGQVPMVKLTEFTLTPPWGRRVHFRRLLEDALGRQVLRQAGALYQFRHAAIKAYLARQYTQPTGSRG